MKDGDNADSDDDNNENERSNNNNREIIQEDGTHGKLIRNILKASFTTYILCVLGS